MNIVTFALKDFKPTEICALDYMTDNKQSSTAAANETVHYQEEVPVVHTNIYHIAGKFDSGKVW